MKRHVFRIAISVFAFVIGTGLVSLFNLATRQSVLPFELENIHSIAKKETVEIKKKPFDLEVKFKKFIPAEYGLAVDFQITNTGSETAYFSGYISEMKKTNRFLPSTRSKLTER